MVLFLLEGPVQTIAAHLPTLTVSSLRFAYPDSLSIRVYICSFLLCHFFSTRGFQFHVGAAVSLCTRLVGIVLMLNSGQFGCITYLQLMLFCRHTQAKPVQNDLAL
jgi:hypothetical protein